MWLHETWNVLEPDLGNCLVASSSLDVLESLLNEGDVTTCKVVIQCFASVYPLLFRLLYVSRRIAVVLNEPLNDCVIDV